MVTCKTFSWKAVHERRARCGGQVVLHVIGAIPDIVIELVTEGVPDIDVVADVVGELVLDIGKKIVIHVIVDIIFDILARPIDPSLLLRKVNVNSQSTK